MPACRTNLCKSEEGGGRRRRHLEQNPVVGLRAECVCVSVYVWQAGFWRYRRRAWSLRRTKFPVCRGSLTHPHSYFWQSRSFAARGGPETYRASFSSSPSPFLSGSTRNPLPNGEAEGVRRAREQASALFRRPPSAALSFSPFPHTCGKSTSLPLAYPVSNLNFSSFRRFRRPRQTTGACRIEQIDSECQTASDA